MAVTPLDLRNALALLTAVAMVSAGCVHARQPERRVHVILSDASEIELNDTRGTGGAGADAYCNEIQKQCFDTCWRRKPELTSIRKHSEKHYGHCSDKCLKVFMRCVAEQEELERQETRKTLRFEDMDGALDWLKNHTADAPPGTPVAVAGVLFVVAIIAGALVLSPI